MPVEFVDNVGRSGRSALSVRSKMRKGLTLLAYPMFVNAVVRHRVAAATEHLEAIRFCAASTLLDAGANKGQFSLAFRKLRPEGRIIAFEPLPDAADTFEQVFASHHPTELKRVALAATQGTSQFHVADRADSSSLLRPGEGQRRAFNVRALRDIEVKMERLDDCVDLRDLVHPVMLKVDVQGGELLVFEGCAALHHIDFIYVELSFIELYEGQPLFQEVCDYLLKRGFAVAGLYNQVATDEYGPTQIDVLFKRAAL